MQLPIISNQLMCILLNAEEMGELPSKVSFIIVGSSFEQGFKTLWLIFRQSLLVIAPP
jgi:hypothetical protein